MPVGNIDRLIKSCKIKYDNVQKYNPILPTRKVSKEEI